MPACSRPPSPACGPGRPRQLAKHPGYDEWKDVRNILAHRASYGRVISRFGRVRNPMTCGERDIPINDQVTRSSAACSWNPDSMLAAALKRSRTTRCEAAETLAR